MKKLLYILLFVPLALFGQDLISININSNAIEYEDTSVNSCWEHFTVPSTQIDVKLNSIKEIHLSYELSSEQICGGFCGSIWLEIQILHSNEVLYTYLLDECGILGTSGNIIFNTNFSSPDSVMPTINFITVDIFSNSIFVVDSIKYLPIYGCTDANAENYNPYVNIDDGSCYSLEEGSTLSQIDGFTYGGFYDGSYYYVSNVVDNWSNADSICSSYEGHLATIQNSNQNEFISSLINSEVEDAWIGLSNYANGNYVWIDDTEVIFTNWASEEPGGFDANGNPENFGLIHSTGTWNDGYVYTLHQFIMEIVAIYGCIDSEYYTYNPQANTDDDSCMSYEEYTIDSLDIVNQVLLEESSLALSSLQQALDTWNTTIDLSSGWNMIGYGCPSPIDVAEGLSNHIESIAIVKDNNGSVYMPEFSFNGIGNFTPGFGYQIKVTEAIEGFSLCDWYVNDIPEDNIVSLQEENVSLQASLDSIYGCTYSWTCNYDETAILNDGSCYNNDLGCGCDVPGPIEGLDCDGNALPEYQVGDLTEGGIVFYVDETGDRGLVVAMEDIGDYIACSQENVGEVDFFIGAGYQNTIDRVNQGCVNEEIFAAQATLDYEHQGYTDWFLPSAYELLEIYNTVPSDIGQFSFIQNNSDFQNTYISSSGTYRIIFGSDNYTITINDPPVVWVSFYSTGKVRPIRAFGTLTMGCLDEAACNYNSDANMANGSCEYADWGYECAGSTNIQVGDEVFGGIVFYVDESGEHGLVAAMEDLGQFEWGCYGTDISGADEQAIGAGYQNTLDIVAGCSQSPIAASEVLTYESGGYSDWYLPSKDELIEMYYTIGQGADNIGWFDDGYYWSSSEGNYNTASPVDYSYGGFNVNTLKYHSYTVRPIRSF